MERVAALFDADFGSQELAPGVGLELVRSTLLLSFEALEQPRIGSELDFNCSSKREYPSALRVYRDIPHASLVLHASMAIVNSKHMTLPPKGYPFYKVESVL
jgi:hypothetical protein